VVDGAGDYAVDLLESAKKARKKAAKGGAMELAVKAFAEKYGLNTSV
jgi:hypothetical protein